MIKLVKINLGVEEVIIGDCLTMKRAREFKALADNNNSFPNKIQYKIEEHWGNTTTSEKLEKRYKRKCTV